MEFVVGLNRPGFDGGGDDRKDHCHGLKEILVGAAGAGHEDERRRRWLARRGPRAWCAGSVRIWESTPRICAPGSRRLRSMVV